MTERNEAVLEFIKLYQKAYPGFSPTYRLIMEAVDIPSTSLVSYCINRLTKEGEIEDSSGHNQTNRHGVVLQDTVLLTREDALELGLDWRKLTAYRDQARVRVKRMVNGYAGH